MSLNEHASQAVHMRAGTRSRPIGPRVVRDGGLVDDSGWVPVDRHTLHTRFPAVYALGDVTGIPLKMGKPLPKAGVFAEREAEVVAHNLALAITGRGEPTSFGAHQFPTRVWCSRLQRVDYSTRVHSEPASGFPRWMSRWGARCGFTTTATAMWSDAHSPGKPSRGDRGAARLHQCSVPATSTLNRRPQITLHRPSRRWHVGKVLFERSWLRRGI